LSGVVTKGVHLKEKKIINRRGEGMAFPQSLVQEIVPPPPPEKDEEE